MAEINKSAFERTLEKFKVTLTPEEQSDFEFTSLSDLKRTILAIQQRQRSEKRLKNMTRLTLFLQAMEQYGKIIEVFLNNSVFISYVWGPMKFLLQVASTYAEGFNKILEAYQDLGENMPLLVHYQALLGTNPHMSRTMELLYEDILEFHRKALQYFKKPLWKKLFEATWKSFQTSFSGLLENIRRHKALVQSHATLSQWEESQRARVEAEAAFLSTEEAERKRRLTAVSTWLDSANTWNDQEKYSEIRREHPTTGHWLFQVDSFQSWQDPDVCSTPLLWLNGVPGAGKTILASLVIEETRRIPKSTTTFFYCGHKDTRRDSFIALAKGMIGQLLKEDSSLLPYLYEQSATSGEAVLRSHALADELLETCLKNCGKAYIIIDGLDECDSSEVKKIVTWFRRRIEGITVRSRDSIRCLFISQDDGVCRKLLGDISTLPITVEHNKQDIITFVQGWRGRIQEKFILSDEQLDQISRDVSERAQGMFLFAKLVMENLFAQSTRAKLKRELNPERLPRGLNDAYDRIMARILQANPETQDDVKRLLGWLVCAKRPLRWHEIQGAVSIDLDDKCVDFEELQWRVSSKDLCGSLVEIHTDGTVQLVHRTAKQYLTVQHIQLRQEELEMASLCVGYLSLPGFQRDISDAEVSMHVSTGYYAFLDYAAAHWFSHLEAGLPGEVDEQSMDRLAEAFEVFILLYWSPPTQNVTIPKTIRDKFRCFQDYGYYHKLLQAVVWSRKEVYSYGQDISSCDTLKLKDTVSRIRRNLEAMISGSQLALERFYGPNLFKCPNLGCDFFDRGFNTLAAREEHKDKHERSYLCTYEGCPLGTLGYKSQKELDSHLGQYHGRCEISEDDFPSSGGKSCWKCGLVFGSYREFRAHYHLEHKQTRPKGHQCMDCGKMYNIARALERHQSDYHSRPSWTCEGKFDDRTSWGCEGKFDDGTSWGCGLQFPQGMDLLNHVLRMEICTLGVWKQIYEVMQDKDPNVWRYGYIVKKLNDIFGLDFEMADKWYDRMASWEVWKLNKPKLMERLKQLETLGEHVGGVLELE